MNKTMNPEIKARWVAALRSGEYSQGRGQLRKDASFCCLGVLCDLRDPAAWDNGDVDPVAGLPPTDVDDWAGFSCMWTVQINGVTETLYAHNDTGRTFAEIADAIEEQL